MTDPKPASRAQRAQALVRARISAARAGWPFLDHALRAYAHYIKVFGRQLAAAITEPLTTRNSLRFTPPGSIVMLGVVVDIH